MIKPKFQNTMSCTQYPDIYGKYLLPGHIRLLRLLPSEETEASIHCELLHYPLLEEADRRTHPYDALSYCWGDPSETSSIFIREQTYTSEHEVLVTQNLQKALIRLRYRYIERILWIDAVCIDQNNEREKEQQIQLMTKIYGHANSVLVWLGEPADNSDRAIQEIRRAGDHGPENPLNDESTYQSITLLLQRPWFRRIWVWNR